MTRAERAAMRLALGRARRLRSCKAKLLRMFYAAYGTPVTLRYILKFGQMTDLGLHQALHKLRAMGVIVKTHSDATGRSYSMPRNDAGQALLAYINQSRQPCRTHAKSVKVLGSRLTQVEAISRQRTTVSVTW